jgi:hypothetical protein
MTNRVCTMTCYTEAGVPFRDFDVYSRMYHDHACGLNSFV